MKADGCVLLADSTKIGVTLPAFYTAQVTLICGVHHICAYLKIVAYPYVPEAIEAFRWCSKR